MVPGRMMLGDEEYITAEARYMPCDVKPGRRFSRAGRLLQGAGWFCMMYLLLGTEVVLYPFALVYLEIEKDRKKENTGKNLDNPEV